MNDEPPATREVELTPVTGICRACLDEGEATKATFTIPGRGDCARCGAKDRRLYFEAVQ